MREIELIKEALPCDTDYTDKNIQSVSDARVKGRTVCSNYEECNRRSSAEGIQCSRRCAQQMAGFIMDRLLSTESFKKAIVAERKDYLERAPEGKFWVFRNKKWGVFLGKENVINDIVNFALKIIDCKQGKNNKSEERGTKKSQKRVLPEVGPADAMHNAITDIDECYKEIGQKNPLFRTIH